MLRHLLTAVVLCGVLWLPWARAATCRQADIGVSPFALTYEVPPAGSSRHCFKVTKDRACNEAAECCVSPSAKFKTLSLSPASTCVTNWSKYRKTVVWTVDGRKRNAARVVKTGRLRLSSPTFSTVCVEFLAGAPADCGSLQQLCNGDECRFSLDTATVKKVVGGKTIRYPCCLNAPTLSKDECATANGGCHPNAICTNVAGAPPNCACKSGFSGDGKANCTDVDECAIGNGGCHVNATCANVIGGPPICTCTGSLVGDGKTTCWDQQRFNIKLKNVCSDTSQDAAFAAAARRWEQLLVRDAPHYTNAEKRDLTGGVFQTFWGVTVPPYTEDVDDVIMFYCIKPIDGANNALGVGGPIYYRPSYTTISAQMIFDSDDIGVTIPQATFEKVILHEMGHALGLGVWFAAKGCVQNCVIESGLPTAYTCKNAVREHQNIGCAGNLLVETSPGYGEGSGCIHWDEAAYKNELMTPDADFGAVPISRMTLGAIEDLWGDGSVDYTQADAFVCPTPGSVGPASADEVPGAPQYTTIIIKPVGMLT
ncbi:MAG: hypothetical protein J3K34DRAFT_294385 [Monoraphidium minutum]|nr:MAG: hypothetical protein J3K34DRAFT_294385 [Monoraphidium minutum]